MIDARAPIEVFEEIDSTLLEARRRAERGERAPTWLIAKRQTAGRGRRGRAWASLDGNLLATYLGPTAHAPADIALLGFAAGVTIAEAIEPYVPPGRVTLKWPNDVLLDGAKVAGILIDCGEDWLALAFGVNLAHAPTGLDQPTLSIRQVIPPDAPAPDAGQFMAAIRPRLETLAALIGDRWFEPVRTAWLARAHGLGSNACVLQGEQIVEGRITGLSHRGELELETTAGRRRISAGDVYFPSSA